MYVGHVMYHIYVGHPMCMWEFYIDIVRGVGIPCVCGHVI